MLAIGVSLALGSLGTVVSRAWTQRLTRQAAAVDPHVYWVLGLVALMPAWLVTFLSLLGASPAPRLEAWAAAAWVASASAALLGTIVTENLVRRASEGELDQPSARYWKYGLVSLSPAWI